VIVTVTSSTMPVLLGSWVSAGAHINAVGACRPDWRGLGDAVGQRARTWGGLGGGALGGVGEGVGGGEEWAGGGGGGAGGGGAGGTDRLAGEIGAVAAGMLAGRSNPREITIFKSLGVAVEDVAAAELVRASLVTGE